MSGPHAAQPAGTGEEMLAGTARPRACERRCWQDGGAPRLAHSRHLAPSRRALTATSPGPASPRRSSARAAAAADLRTGQLRGSRRGHGRRRASRLAAPAEGHACARAARHAGGALRGSATAGGTALEGGWGSSSRTWHGTSLASRSPDGSECRRRASGRESSGVRASGRDSDARDACRATQPRQTRRAGRGRGDSALRGRCFRFKGAHMVGTAGRAVKLLRHVGAGRGPRMRARVIRDMRLRRP